MKKQKSLSNYFEEKFGWSKNPKVISKWKQKAEETEIDKIKKLDIDDSQENNEDNILQNFKNKYITRYTMEIVNANAMNPEKISLANISVKNFFSSLKENFLLRNDIEIGILKEAVIYLSFVYGSKWDIQVRTDTIARPKKETQEMKKLFNIDSNIKLKMNVIKISQNDDDATKSIIYKINKNKLEEGKKEIKNFSDAFKEKKKLPVKIKNIDATSFIDIIKGIFELTNKDLSVLGKNVQKQSEESIE